MLFLSFFAGAASPISLLDSSQSDSTALDVDTITSLDTTDFYAQRLATIYDSLVRTIDSVTGDTIYNSDSLASDSLKLVPPVRRPFLDDKIVGKSADSLTYDVKNRTIYSYKGSDVKYQQMALKADYLRINTQTKLVRAEGIEIDTATHERSRPVFSEGASNYEVDSMEYNMDSGKGLVKGVNTKEGEGVLFGGTVKKMKDNTIHMHNGRYTVCDAECPHFYMQMTKGTTVPGKQTVFGPAYMVFEDVPIYFLGVPFGFFPQKKERNSGVIFPEIGEEYVKGFFVRNGGYYLALNDYFDFRIVGGIYTLGSWQVGAGSNYALKYKFRGNVSFDYASDKIGDKNSKDYVEATNIAIRWSHSQDPKFSPGSAFSASVNYTSASYNKFNAQDLNDYLNSQTSSSINYSRNWAGTPFSLAINGALSQNSRDSIMTINLPNFTFNVARVAPFKRKLAVGKERWYEKISFTYGFDFKNEAANFKEKDFMKKGMFDKMRMGMQHNIPVSASFNVLQYLNISPSVKYNERWYFRRIDQRWDEEAEQVAIDTTNGFYRVYDYSASLSMNTKLYGTYTFGSGRKRKPTILRHVLTPSIGVSFSPDNGSRYYSTVQTDKDAKQFRDYSPFANELYGVPGRGAAASMNVSLSNTLEGKFPSDKDSTGYKKVKILEQLSLSTSYNFIADSMRLSPISLSMSTNLFNKLPLQFSAAFDPYAVDGNGRRINKFLVEEGGFLRLSSLTFSLGWSWQSKGSKPSGQKAINNPVNNTNNQEMAERAAQNSFFEQQDVVQPSAKDLAQIAATQYYDFNIPWSFGFSYSFNYSDYGAGPTVQQSVNFNGSLNITSKWAVSASAGYDFQQKKLTPGAVRITRDLHCWQMSLQWIPVGFRQSWSFNIAVKSSMLSDMLKWEKNNSFMDNYYGNY